MCTSCMILKGLGVQFGTVLLQRTTSYLAFPLRPSNPGQIAGARTSVRKSEIFPIIDHMIVNM